MTRCISRRHALAAALLTLANLTTAWADLPTASPAAMGLSAERLQRIRPVIQKEIDNQQMPGAVVMVIR